MGNLRLDGYGQPHEDPSFKYPESLASPQQILIDASNGASDYGNKFGEPLIAGERMRGIICMYDVRHIVWWPCCA